MSLISAGSEHARVRTNPASDNVLRRAPDEIAIKYDSCITRYARHNTRLMLKVPLAGKDHCDAVLITIV